jgi:hypothetical protein
MLTCFPEGDDSCFISSSTVKYRGNYAVIIVGAHGQLLRRLLRTDHALWTGVEWRNALRLWKISDSLVCLDCCNTPCRSELLTAIYAARLTLSALLSPLGIAMWRGLAHCAFDFYHCSNRCCRDSVTCFNFNSRGVNCAVQRVIKLDGVVLKDESVCTLSGWLIDGVRASSAYDRQPSTTLRRCKSRSASCHLLLSLAQIIHNCFTFLLDRLKLLLDQTNFCFKCLIVRFLFTQVLRSVLSMLVCSSI